MHGQLDPVISFVVGAVSAFISFMFDVPAPAIFAAFVGSAFGVTFTQAVTYRKAALMLLGGTVASGLMVSIFIHYFGDYPPRGVAALLAFVLIKYRDKVLAIIDSTLDKFGGNEGKSE